MSRILNSIRLVRRGLNPPTAFAIRVKQDSVECVQNPVLVEDALRFRVNCLGIRKIILVSFLQARRVCHLKLQILLNCCIIDKRCASRNTRKKAFSELIVRHRTDWQVSVHKVFKEGDWCEVEVSTVSSCSFFNFLFYLRLTYSVQGLALVSPGLVTFGSFSVLKKTVPAPQLGQRKPRDASMEEAQRRQLHLNSQPASLSCRTEKERKWGGYALKEVST